MDLAQTPRPTPSGASPDASRAATPPRRARGLVNEVMENLAANIREGTIKPGEKLPTESAIVARFDVSRTVVREAISRLQANRLVETRHGVGTFALAPQDSGNFKIAAVDLATVTDVIALLELRISLETEAAGLAAQRRTEQHLQSLQAMLDAFAAAIEQDSDAVPSDFQFHREVARATGNRHFADLMTYLGTMIIPRTRVNTPNSAPEGRLAYLRRVHSEHESIFNAIRNQDTDAARAAMRTHLANSKDRLKKSQTEAQ
jgi:GntR family transcriptional regulator, transcriptional repressor for pyruvate dehydrogenase complex